MYCVRNLAQAAQCHTCRQPVAAGFAGYYYNHPLCRACFRECDPELAALLSATDHRTDNVLEEVPPDEPLRRCSGCRQPIRSWLAGRFRRQLLCRRCLRDRSPQLASVLILEEAVRTLVEDRAPSSQYLELARHYVDARRRLAG